MTSKVYVALRVSANPLRTFEAFTDEIASWWQADRLFQLTPRGDGALAFEPGVGGRLLSILGNGEVYEIGRVSVWEPGRQLIFTWRPVSFTPEQSTEVEVRFEAVGDETRISIEHRAWDTIPRRHVARHGFPETVTLQRAADWWRTSLGVLKEKLTR
jgi:Activator of Hsp90 ATPase homolog 1-like protein